MRWFYLLLLALFAAALAAFALENPDPLTVRYLGRAVDLTLPQLAGAAYGLGMASGWTVVGILRRSVRRATED